MKVKLGNLKRLINEALTSQFREKVSAQKALAEMPEQFQELYELEQGQGTPFFEENEDTSFESWFAERVSDVYVKGDVVEVRGNLNPDSWATWSPSTGWTFKGENTHRDGY